MTINTKVEIEWKGSEFNQYMIKEFQLLSQGFRKDGKDVFNHENGELEYRSFFSKHEYRDVK